MCAYVMRICLKQVAGLQGVEFEQQHVNITDEYKSLYDEAAAVWLQLREAIGQCKEELGIINPALHKVSCHPS